MKKAFLVFFGVGIALAVGFWILSREAISPNGELMTSTSVAPSAAPKGNITVDGPRSGDLVDTNFIVTGLARTFENNVLWRLRDDAGRELVHGFTTANAADVGQFGEYLIHVAVPAGASKDVVLEVFESSAKDGSEIHKVTVPVRLKQ